MMTRNAGLEYRTWLGCAPYRLADSRVVPGPSLAFTPHAYPPAFTTMSSPWRTCFARVTPILLTRASAALDHVQVSASLLGMTAIVATKAAVVLGFFFSTTQACMHTEYKRDKKHFI